MNIICLVLDRLHAGYLGPYGNTRIQTPAFNRFACQSVSFDQMLIDTPDLDRLYRSYWQGWHALCSHEPPSERRSFLAALRESGFTTTLLSDEPLVLQHSLASEFCETLELNRPWHSEVTEEVEQTHLARCFGEMIDWLPSASSPFFLWCHLGSLGMTWDAPLEFREIYEDGDEDDDDREASVSAEVPEAYLEEKTSSDELRCAVQTYSGQISLLDCCLSAFLEELENNGIAKDTLFLVTSSRGFPLGEHRSLGPCRESLFNELVHVPLMIRFPDGRGASERSQNLVEPADLWATLWQAALNEPLPFSPTALSLLPVIDQESAPRHDRLCIAGHKHERAIRTPGWYLRDVGHGELFAKPDDRWEVNDVANRCLEIVEGLQQTRVAFEQTLHSGSLADLSPLDPLLLHGFA